MDMSKFAGNRKDFLKPAVLLDKNLSEIKVEINDVREHDFGDGKGAKAILDLSSKDEDFSFVLNVINTNSLIDRFGVDSESWLGESVVISLDKTEMQGKKVDCLRVK